MSTPLPSVAPPPSGRLSAPAWDALLTRLRGYVEHSGVPFEVARAACGVDDRAHRAWLARAAELERKSPTWALGADGVLRVGGSDEPEAEYARIAATADARAAAKYLAVLDRVALDDARGASQVTALTTALKALAPRHFGTQRVEAQVTADVAAIAGPRLDQAALDALTPAQRVAVVDAARAVADARRRGQEAQAALQSALASPDPRGLPDPDDDCDPRRGAEEVES